MPATQVAARFRLVGTEKNSGARVDREIGIRVHHARRRLWRMRAFLDPDDARRAVGLQE